MPLRIRTHRILSDVILFFVSSMLSYSYLISHLSSHLVFTLPYPYLICASRRFHSALTHLSAGVCYPACSCCTSYTVAWSNLNSPRTGRASRSGVHMSCKTRSNRWPPFPSLNSSRSSTSNLRARTVSIREVLPESG
jgi:hypothetical protein